MIEIVVWLSLAVQSSVIITRDRPHATSDGRVGKESPGLVMVVAR